MSPLGYLILRAMRAGSLGSAGFVALVLGIEIWKRWRFGGLETMGRQDLSFLAVLVILIVGFLWLARSIAKEIARSKP